MASENLKVDQNNKPVVGFVTDDANQFIKMGRIDDTTKGLKVMLVGGTGTGTVTSITQGTGILLTPSPIIATGSVALATTLQPIATLTGNSLKVLRVNAGETAVEYATISGGIPGGLNAQVQYNNSGSFGGITGATTDGTAVSLTSAHLLNPTINGVGAGLATLAYPNTASNATLTLPTTTDTLIGKATTDTLTNKTFNTAGTGNSFSINGTAITAVNGTGAVSLTTSPTFVTPILGAATATSINGNIFTTGSSTFTGTAAQTYTFPSTTATIARTDAAQTFTGTQTFSQTILTANAIAASGNAATVPITSGRNIVTNNSAATLTITLTTASAVNMQTCIVQILDFSGVAQTLTFVNTENSTVSVPATTNGSTTLPLTVGFIYNSATSKWRCVASA